MRKQASLPVRLDPEMSDRLDAIALRLNLNKSAIVRLLVEAFVDYWNKHGGKIVMPPEFKTYDIQERKHSK